MVDLRQRVELTLIPAGNDSTVLIEWQQRGTRFHEIKLPSSWTAARGLDRGPLRMRRVGQ